MKLTKKNLLMFCKKNRACPDGIRHLKKLFKTKTAEEAIKSAMKSPWANDIYWLRRRVADASSDDVFITLGIGFTGFKRQFEKI
jgi:hypothetical protein